MKKNTKATLATSFDTETHEGGPARTDNPARELRRAVLACLLWEQKFYENGEDIAKRIVTLASALPAEDVAALAIEARNVFNLRHVPLLLLTVLAKTGAGKEKLVANTVANVIQRADEPGELLAIYWGQGNKKKTIPAQFKKGLARAISKFDAYQLGKYNRDGAVKLRDVLFLTHPKPVSGDQDQLWKKLVDKTLEAPDTWEVSLSAGADKKDTFERLLKDNKLGYLALLRNLRNMDQANVDEDLMRNAILARKGAQRVFPFRYVAAAKACPKMEPYLDKALLAAIDAMEPFPGKTIVLVDISGSMHSAMSGKSDMRYVEAAAALASVIKGDIRTFTFDDRVREVPHRYGMAGVDAIINSGGGGTMLGEAVEHVNALQHDRLIVITDEQSHDQVPPPMAEHAYMINVGGYKPSVSYEGFGWTKIEGWSEGVIRYIQEIERA
jgi:60 kDa SS-A/Ro ribonucleoprotein